MTKTRTPWSFHALTADRWDDVVRLFGPRGACAGCWCMFPRNTSSEGSTSGEPNRRAFRKLVKQGPAPGVLAYEGDEPVGWVAIAPRAEYRRFERSRVLAPVDDREVWSVPCFFVARSHRGRGLTVALLRAACEWARDRGARIVEGYPVDTRGKVYAATFAFHGLPSAFAAAGFREVLRRSDRRPIMRRALRAGAPGPDPALRRVPPRGVPRFDAVAELTERPIDPAGLLALAGRPDCGALALFLGTSRDHHEGRRVSGLAYEAYAPMALEALAAIEREALERFAIANCAIVHRLGEVPIGEASVAVVVAAAHRGPAFDACRWAMDELKRTVPIWKKERYVEGGEGWVEGSKLG